MVGDPVATSHVVKGLVSESSARCIWNLDACCLCTVHGSSGVPGELMLMLDTDSLGVVEENMISPHESKGWLQSWPNMVGGDGVSSYN